MLAGVAALHFLQHLHVSASIHLRSLFYPPQMGDDGAVPFNDLAWRREYTGFSQYILFLLQTVNSASSLNRAINGRGWIEGLILLWSIDNWYPLSPNDERRSFHQHWCCTWTVKDHTANTVIYVPYSEDPIGIIATYWLHSQDHLSLRRTASILLQFHLFTYPRFYKCTGKLCSILSF